MNMSKTKEKNILDQKKSDKIPSKRYPTISENPKIHLLDGELEVSYRKLKEELY